MDEERMPLFLINGFLEAGKTEFIKFTMDQDYFKTEGKTLLIVCEEGEEEYEDEFLEVERVPFTRLAERVMAGEITDAKTVALVLKAKLLLGL